MGTPLPLHRVIPEGRRGRIEIAHVDVDASAAAFTRIRAMQHPMEYVPPGRYVHLYVGGVLMMSDTPTEGRTCGFAVWNATGDVLIAGMGIGMILRDILAKPGVRSVTVVEIEPDVVALVEPAMRACPGGEKLHVVLADIESWTPPEGASYDTIWFDIWAQQGERERRQITRLHRRFARYLRRDGWMASWRAHREPLVARIRRARTIGGDG